MSQAQVVGPTPEEPDPPGGGDDQSWRELFTLVELLVLLDNDSSPAVLLAGLLLWALFLAGWRR